MARPPGKRSGRGKVRAASAPAGPDRSPPPSRRGPERGARLPMLLGAAGLVAAAVAAVLWLREGDAPTVPATSPAPAASRAAHGSATAASPVPPVALVAAAKETTATYVGRDACGPCHAEEVRSFTGSHHDLAMQVADETTVLGDFDGASFEHHGVRSRFSRRDGKYYVETDGPDGKPHEYEIAHVFGVEPLQQYLVAMPGGREHALPIAWDSRPATEGGQRWFHLLPDDPLPPDDELHWAQPAQAWNDRCAFCHSTNLIQGYRADGDRYETTWSEIDVSCEACHGPASEHVARAKAGAPPEQVREALAVGIPKRSAAAWVFDGASPIARRSAPRASDAEIESCAPCHARRGDIWSDGDPTLPFLDRYEPSLLVPGLYFADGQIDGEVYEYGSFLQSAMYRAGVTCSDCHDPHSLKLRAEGNAVCGQCHLSTHFDTPGHTFHPAGSPGSQCVACHMPARTYMGIDVRHDHGFRIPRPDVSAKVGAPDACTACHTDRTQAWAAETIAGWGKDAPARPPHYGEAIAAGRGEAIDAGAKLAALAAQADAPAIVRASAISLLGGVRGPQALAAVEAAAADRDPLLRLAAVQASEGLDPRAVVEIAAPRLADPTRAVRLAAAHALAGVPSDVLPPEQQSALARATEEYRSAQKRNSDRPESHVNLGVLAAREGRPDEAEAELRTALARSPHFVPASVNLADVLRASERDADGEVVLRRALERSPEAPSAHHALGLLLIRTGRTQEGLQELARAAELAPDEPRYAYVYGVGLHSTGEHGRALEVLQAAHRRRPGNRDLLFALATMNRDAGNRAAALEYARKLATASPGDPGAAALLAQLESAPAP
jgi:Flp pilus assembly protein TadD